MYQGNWKDGQYHGVGAFVNDAQGTLYDGDWVQDVKHGKGKLQWERGNQEYDGDYEEGERTGEGVYTNNLGTRYQGHFLKGDYHGHGKLFMHENGRLFEGKFNHNNLSKGKIVLPDGSVYEGDIKDWKMHGQGNLKFTNGNVYVGTWDKD